MNLVEFIKTDHEEFQSVFIKAQKIQLNINYGTSTGYKIFSKDDFEKIYKCEKQEFEKYEYDNCTFSDDMIVIDVHLKNYGLAIGDVVRLAGQVLVIESIVDNFAFLKLQNNVSISVSCLNLCKYKTNSKSDKEFKALEFKPLDVVINGENNRLYLVREENGQYVFVNDKIQIKIDKDIYKI